MNAFSARLNLELERNGWAERSRLLDAMVEASRARDSAAYDEAKRKFDEAMRTER